MPHFHHSSVSEASVLFSGAECERKSPAPCKPQQDVLSQTKIPPPGADLPIDTNPSLSSGAQDNQANDERLRKQYGVSLIQEAAEQNTQGVITNTNNLLLQGRPTPPGVEKFW